MTAERNNTEKVIWGVGIGAPLLLTAIEVLGKTVTLKDGLTQLLPFTLAVGILLAGMTQIALESYRGWRLARTKVKITSSNN